MIVTSVWASWQRTVMIREVVGIAALLVMGAVVLAASLRAPRSVRWVHRARHLRAG